MRFRPAERTTGRAAFLSDQIWRMNCLRRQIGEPLTGPSPRGAALMGPSKKLYFRTTPRIAAAPLHKRVIVRQRAWAGSHRVLLADGALRDVNRLGLDVVVEALGAALAADAGLLEAAEGMFRVDDHAVDGDAARAHAARDRIAAIRVRREDRTRKAVGGVVGLGDGIVLVGVGDNGHHGAEDLLLEDLHVRL